MPYPESVHTQLNRVMRLVFFALSLRLSAAWANTRDLPEHLLNLSPDLREIYETRVLPQRDCATSLAGYVLDPEKDALLLKAVDAIRLAEEVVSGRGNGAVVFLKDGRVRFADMLTDEELKSVVNPPAAFPGFSPKCDPDSVSRFKLADDERAELIQRLKSLAVKNPDLAILIASSVDRFINNAVFSKYLFPREQGRWRSNTRIEEEKLVSIDLHTGIVPVIYEPLHRSLPLSDRVASLIHSALRDYSVDKNGLLPEAMELKTIEKAAGLIAQGKDLDQVGALFHMTEAGQLNPAIQSLRSMISGITADLGAGQKISAERLNEVYESVSRFESRYLQNESQRRLSFRIAGSLQVKGNSDIGKAFDLYDDWYRASRELNAFQSELEKESRRKDSKILDGKARKLILSRGPGIGATRALMEKQLIESKSAFNGEALMDRSFENMHDLFKSSDPKTVKALCIVIDGIFAADPKVQNPKMKLPQ